MVERLGAGLVGFALVVALTAACSDSEPGKPSPMTGGSAGAPATGASGSSGAGSGAGGGNASGAGGMPHVPPMRLADDPTGITGLEDCALAVDGACLQQIGLSKAEVCERWQADRPQRATSLQLTETLECDPGMSTPNAVEDALRRLNLFRWLGGGRPLALDPTWDDYARSCAIIQSYIAPEITHFPEASAPCFTEQGYTASGQSQIASGRSSPAAAIDGLIYDSGDNNFHILGHRQNMLVPQTTTVGLGFADPLDGMPVTCLRTFDGPRVERPTGVAGVYTFPAFGHQPWEVVADGTYQESGVLEWSVTLPYDADATNGKVRLLRLRGSSWEDVPVTAGPFLDERFFGLWVDVGVKQVEPGTYAVIVSGTSVGTFGYQLRLEQCTEVPLRCDVLTQDCGAGIGCYKPAQPYCRKPQGLPVGAPCTGWDNAECVAGADCVPALVTGVATCTQYCDPNNPSAPKACELLCPGAFFEIYDDAAELAGAQCLPGAGGECNPLASQCGPDQSCQGWEPPACGPFGTTAIGQECDPFLSGCVAGATCIGSQGSTKLFCEPYCDPVAASGPSACPTLCPLAYFDFDTYGICIPPE